MPHRFLYSQCPAAAFMPHFEKRWMRSYARVSGICNGHCAFLQTARAIWERRAVRHRENSQNTKEIMDGRFLQAAKKPAVPGWAPLEGACFAGRRSPQRGRGSTSGSPDCISVLSPDCELDGASSVPETCGSLPPQAVSVKSIKHASNSANCFFIIHHPSTFC